jgi:voltage-gated sodium channel
VTSIPSVPATPRLPSLRQLVESRRFDLFITALIVVNAITLGLETSDTVMAGFGGFLHALDSLILAVFVAELVLKLVVYRLDFFRDPWRLFDLFVIGITFLPATEGLSVLRSLRVMRVLRLISVVPTLRRVVGGFVKSLPGMGSIILLLALVFYVFAVMATKLYGETFPQWFGTLGASSYTLFQVMTLEGWSDGLVRPVMEVHPLAWAFFLPFIVVTAFAVLNLFIGVIVQAMQEEHESLAEKELAAAQDSREVILVELRALREEVRALRAAPAAAAAE